MLQPIEWRPDYWIDWYHLTDDKSPSAKKAGLRYAPCLRDGEDKIVAYDLQISHRDLAGLSAEVRARKQ
jgi:hypothetical protein